jgi:hypothetical protein
MMVIPEVHDSDSSPSIKASLPIHLRLSRAEQTEARTEQVYLIEEDGGKPEWERMMSLEMQALSDEFSIPRAQIDRLYLDCNSDYNRLKLYLEKEYKEKPVTFGNARRLLDREIDLIKPWTELMDLFVHEPETSSNFKNLRTIRTDQDIKIRKRYLGI